MTQTDPGPAEAVTPAAGERRVQRYRRGAVVAGVAGGVAEHLDVPVLRVRIAFTVLCALGGAGVLAYGGLWVFCPLEPAGTEREVDDRDRLRGYGLVALGLALALVLSAVGDQISGWILGPLGVALVGAAVVWREADGGSGTGRGRTRVVSGRAGVLRAVLGAVLVAGGIAAFLLGSLDVGAVQFGLLAATATLVGVVVLTVPWWMRLVRELSAERRERIRSEERAEIAAHLHDSVLQTLALIQRHTEVAGDETAREVRRLARRQERELRDWLYQEAGDETPTPETTCFGAALRTAAGDVEDTFAVSVAPVIVGDAVFDVRTAALVAAAREAMTNAAKHAGVEEVSVYAEVEDGTVSVFVRDRGKGFEPDAVPTDRHGLADSIHARVERHGGTVRLRTAPGEGTEVGLTMPRTEQPSEVA
ncbi:ATP-binding protein [Actinomycetospora termitidis]|uniref:PspC domain-containing protein n=1 Tax=Actinomycetospora termitidis TaxID=3053470 RepID=A0ABT7M4C7_9PSEU|nr:ATP-binding protein [Actinomycetospora sp. Odt1-22]MDL5155520.1 PspC domain-containing protein [Actinomycetospora sp. Odt1-22]